MSQNSMKAIGYTQSLPATDSNALVDLELEMPVPSARDLLVRISAIAVNPVDFKIRQAVNPKGNAKVLGWDAVGEVVATGEAVSNFKPGDLVYYAGDLTRQGANAEYHLVDERIVGRKPSSLTNSEAAALPLTTITAYELLFDHLMIAKQDTPSDEVILVVGAAGGVGSILIQLAKALTGATIIATASRPSSQEWVTSLGADFVVDHTQPLKPQIKALVKEGKVGQVTHVASLTHTGSYFEEYLDLLVPFGKIGLIDDPGSLDVMNRTFKLKSLSLHIEFMFARSMFQAKDMERQGELLNHVTELVDAGQVKTTVGKHLGSINAANLRQAHVELESGKTIGKLVLEGFGA